MNIVFDSNLIRGDFPLKGTDFDILLDYLQKTQSLIIMPQIIWDEVVGLYRKEFELRITKYEAAKGNINKMLTNTNQHISKIEFSIEKEVENYEVFLRNKLNLAVRSFLPYKDIFLKEIAKRAINREKPCGEEGQGFRDALIWLTIKEYTMNSLERQIIYISGNYSDFGYKDRGGLHESLQKECDNVNIKIHYFKSFEEFVKEHSRKIEYLNAEWVKANVTNEEIFEMVNKRIITDDSAQLFLYIKNLTSNELIAVSHIKKIDPFSFNNVFVYEMSDNKLVVHCDMYCTLSVEYLESIGNKLVSGSYFNQAAPIQIVASLTIVLENNRIIEKSINQINYYHNF